MKDRQTESSYVATDDKSENIVSKVFFVINNLSALVQKFYFEHRDEIDAKIQEIRESDEHKSLSVENVDMAIREQHIIESERRQTAKEILTYVGNLYDDCDQRFRLKDYQWHKDLCKKHGVQLDDTL